MESKLLPFPVDVVSLVSFEDFCNFLRIEDTEDARMAMQGSDFSFGTNDDTLVTPLNFMNEMIDAGLITEIDRDAFVDFLGNQHNLYVSLGC
jgi:hypothetical protein